MGLIQLQQFYNTHSNYILFGIIVLILSILLFIYNKNNNTNNALAETHVNKSDTYDTFQQNIKKEKSTKIILFYAMWCGHSRNFLPVWEECKKIFLIKYPTLDVIGIECGDNDDRCKGVPGFPTIRFYKDGQTEEYLGPRTIDGLDTFIAGRINN
jgi:thiol-disulfide isomerase/thioredoxin